MVSMEDGLFKLFDMFYVKLLDEPDLDYMGIMSSFSKNRGLGEEAVAMAKAGLQYAANDMQGFLQICREAEKKVCVKRKERGDRIPLSSPRWQPTTDLPIPLIKKPIPTIQPTTVAAHVPAPVETPKVSHAIIKPPASITVPIAKKVNNIAPQAKFSKCSRKFSVSIPIEYYNKAIAIVGEGNNASLFFRLAIMDYIDNIKE